MKYLIITICFICYPQLISAQPGGKKFIYIEKAFYKNKLVYFLLHKKGYRSITKDSAIIYEAANDNYMAISSDFIEKSNNYYNFIHNGDTMKIKVHYNKYDPTKIAIKKLSFIKGSFNIDLLACTKKLISGLKRIPYPIIIPNFPCDCLEFQIPEPSLPKVQADSTAIK
jgi:hypothetical protein